jgi:hypothetical protein
MANDEAMFQCCPRPRYPLDARHSKLSEPKEEPAFTKLVYLEGSL